MYESKNYRVGWVIPGQVGALTHYTPDVTLEDFQDIAHESHDLFETATQPFHVIIDNRIMNMAFLPDLDAIKGSADYMNNPNLRHIVMIKPEGMDGSANELPSYEDDNATLTYVDNLNDAVSLLKAEDETLDWSVVESDFFPNAKFE